MRRLREGDGPLTDMARGSGFVVEDEEQVGQVRACQESSVLSCKRSEVGHECGDSDDCTRAHLSTEGSLEATSHFRQHTSLPIPDIGRSAWSFKW